MNVKRKGLYKPGWRNVRQKDAQSALFSLELFLFYFGNNQITLWRVTPAVGFSLIRPSHFEFFQENGRTVQYVNESHQKTARKKGKLSPQEQLRLFKKNSKNGRRLNR